MCSPQLLGLWGARDGWGTVPGGCTGALLRGWGGKGSTTAPPGGLSSTKPDRGGHLHIPQRPLYPGLQTLSPVLPPGSAGIPNHSLSGFPFLAPAQAGKSWPRAPRGSKTPNHAPPTAPVHFSSPAWQSMGLVRPHRPPASFSLAPRLRGSPRGTWQRWGKERAGDTGQHGTGSGNGVREGGISG